VLRNRVQQDKWKSGGSTVTTRFAYDGENIWADLDGSNNLQVRYLYGDGVDQILARIVSSGQPNAGVAWYLTDRLGSLRDLENGSTQVAGDHVDYDGFGNPTETASSYGDRYKYTAREWDGDTGLQYNRARYYNPTIGRWANEDPSGIFADDTNLYRYVQNQATLLTDPTGLVAQLSAKTTIPIQLGEFGEFVWGIKWKLSEASKNGGWIIQRVRHKFTVTKDGQPRSDVRGTRSHDFYEAWYVEKGSKERDLNYPPILVLYDGLILTSLLNRNNILNRANLFLEYTASRALYDDIYSMGKPGQLGFDPILRPRYRGTDGRIDITGDAFYIEEHASPFAIGDYFGMTLNNPETLAGPILSGIAGKPTGLPGGAIFPPRSFFIEAMYADALKKGLASKKTKHTISVEWTKNNSKTQVVAGSQSP
jgi:RHS repeat-associated protein